MRFRTAKEANRPSTFFGQIYSFGIRLGPWLPRGGPASILQLDSFKCSTISLATASCSSSVSVRRIPRNRANPFRRPILTQKQRSSAAVHIVAQHRNKAGTLSSPPRKAGRPKVSRWGTQLQGRAAPRGPGSAGCSRGRARMRGLRFTSDMLRHACGFYLANKSRDTRSLAGRLGHKSMSKTQRYAALAPNRFKEFWED